MYTQSYIIFFILEHRTMWVSKQMSSLGKMQSIDNLPNYKLQRKISSFRPVTRLQKIRDSQIIYPKSNKNKFVFASNLGGTGFTNHIHPSCPFYNQVAEMLSKINSKCYKQWQINKQHNQRNPFQCLDWISNISIVLMCFLALILYFLNLKNSIETQALLYTFLTFVISTLIISLTAYFKENQEYDSDFQTIKAIKAILEYLNNQQIIKTRQRPRFVWECHKQCIWIALNIHNFDNE